MMKKSRIKTIKWIILYVVAIFLWVVLFKNFFYFKNFWRHFADYYNVDNLKARPVVSFSQISGYDFDNLLLDFKDKINLKVLSKDFTGALSEYFLSSTFSYKDYFNIWNIFLLKGYFWFWNTWYVQNIQNALSYYKISLENAPSYVWKKNILVNDDFALGFLNFSYVYFCDNLFLSMISKTNFLLEKLDRLVSILKKQLTVLNKRYYYQDFKKCIDSLKSDASKNIYLVYQNKAFFLNVKKGLFYKLIGYNHKEFDCYQKRNLIIWKYADSIQNSISYFNKFYTLQSNLLKVYSWASYTQMKLLCDNKSKVANKLSQENKKMEKNYQKLSDLANQPKPHRKKKNKEQANSNKNKSSSNQKNENGKKNPAYEKQFEEYTKSVLDNLRKKNQNIIKQIMDEKSQDKFNPKQYIDRLFKSFNWKEDYYLYKKEQTSGK